MAKLMSMKCFLKTSSRFFIKDRCHLSIEMSYYVSSFHLKSKVDVSYFHTSVYVYEPNDDTYHVFDRTILPFEYPMVSPFFKDLML